eukprot:scaffold1079_cov191-Amphora_coffeaeformis.AAC.6
MQPQNGDEGSNYSRKARCRDGVLGGSGDSEVNTNHPAAFDVAWHHNPPESRDADRYRMHHEVHQEGEAHSLEAIHLSRRLLQTRTEGDQISGGHMPLYLPPWDNQSPGLSHPMGSPAEYMQSLFSSPHFLENALSSRPNEQNPATTVGVDMIGQFMAGQFSGTGDHKQRRVLLGTLSSHLFPQTYRGDLSDKTRLT